MPNRLRLVPLIPVVSVSALVMKRKSPFDSRTPRATSVDELPISTPTMYSITLPRFGLPFPLEVAAALAAFFRPNHIVDLCSWGLIRLPPTCNINWFGYKPAKDLIIAFEFFTRQVEFSRLTDKSGTDFCVIFLFQFVRDGEQLVF